MTDTKTAHNLSFWKHPAFGMVIRGMLLQAAILGIAVNCFGVFMVAICEDKGFSTASFSAYQTIRVLSGAILMPFVSKLIYEHLGKYNRYVSMVLGALLFVGMMLSTTFESIYLWYGMGLITGITVMFIMINQAIIINNWFKDRYAFALSLVGLASGLAGAVFSPMASWMITRFGWETAMIVISALGLAMIIVGSTGLFLTPQERGMTAYHDTIKRGQAQSKPLVTDVLFSKADAVLLFFALLLVFFCNVTLSNSLIHLPNFASGLGYTLEIGALFSTFAMIGNAGGKILLGTLADRLNDKRLVVIVFAIIGGSLFLSTVQNLPLMLLLFCSMVMGFAQGAQFVLLPAVCRNLYGQRSYAKVYPKLFSVSTILAAPMVSLAGASYDATGSYSDSLLVWGVFYIFSCLLLVFVFIIAKRGKQQTT